MYVTPQNLFACHYPSLLVFSVPLINHLSLIHILNSDKNNAISDKSGSGICC